MNTVDRRINIVVVLTRHFFRRFFDNDTVQPEGDTATTVVRALSFVAAPGLLIAFFVGLTRYPELPIWAAAVFRCFFIVFSFVAIGVVAIFEWEMLFPDKLDFLVLTPLPIRPVQMFLAKAGALTCFLGLFVFAANIFSTLLLPTGLRGSVLRQYVAHFVATASAGAFAALLFLAIGGVVICLLSPQMFRAVSPFLQMLAVLSLFLMFFAYMRFAGLIPSILQKQPMGAARWLPPLWFLGLYEEMLYGHAAPAFAPGMAGYALRALVLAVGIVVITYPLAWARVRKATIEGNLGRPGSRLRGLGRLASALVRSPGERAMFNFIGQTLARNNHYQVYLAMYCGTGLALAMGISVSVRVTGGATRLGLSDYGLHAVMPMLVLWTIAGLRTAIAFPVNLKAGWIFPVTGVDLRQCATAARHWATACAGFVTVGIVLVLWLAGWDLRGLVIQAACGACLCLLLSDGFFFAQRSIPFHQPRMPGQLNFPLMLTLYVGVFPQFIIGMSRLEFWLEKHTWHLVTVCLTVAILHQIAAMLRGLSTEGESHAEYDGEFQVLGLTTQ